MSITGYEQRCRAPHRPTICNSACSHVSVEVAKGRFHASPIRKRRRALLPRSQRRIDQSCPGLSARYCAEVG
jgi:hypothetical protein